jgi:hypothetical protein
MRQAAQESGIQGTAAEDRAHCCQLLADPRLRPLESKTSVLEGVSGLTFAMKANPDYLAEADKPLVDLWSLAQEECQRRELARAERLAPSGVPPILRQMNASGAAVKRNLYMGRITWGQYNLEREHLVREGDAALDRALDANEPDTRANVVVAMDAMPGLTQASLPLPGDADAP